MKKTVVLLSFICFWVLSGYSQTSNYLDFPSVKDMYSFFTYGKNKKVISGHRGTVEYGLPENSIEGMAEVLKHTYAIFELDPRLTKDGIPVLMHDATLERTTTGVGKVSDFTLEELKKLFLKDVNGNITPYKIPTLEEVIIWAKGKTILNLDKKDLPMQLTADIIKRHRAYNWVWVTVHNPEQAKFYLEQNPNQYLSMHIRNTEALKEFKESGLPYDRMIVYIGSKIVDSNQELINFFKTKGVMCMMSSAPTYDKLPRFDQRAAMYREVFESGACILESDYPIEVSKAIQ